MRTVVDAAIIQRKRLVVVRKEREGESFWILPGGKIEPGEKDLACLTRELGEELPALRLPGSFRLYGIFSGISPHKREPIKTVVYLYQEHSDRELNLTLSANLTEPIKEARQLDYSGLLGLGNRLSQATLDIVQALKKDNYL